ANKTLKIHTCVSGGRACIEFRDSGAGMDDKTLERVFEPLFSTKSFGIGLGLSTVQQVVSGHAGEVDI
ncbi:MAG: hypothetical protein GWN87_22700, partial [Desulfuromonadales bacterium]|nr:hypothetical protein [Desulfuromonadales bacterium]